MKLKISFIRHGKTRSNIEKKYVGITDDPLCDEGVEGLKTLWVDERKTINTDSIYVSPMMRCRQTAEIIFPAREKRIIEDLRELDLGEFEGKTHDELISNPHYQKFISSFGNHPTPNGEAPDDFKNRCTNALLLIASELEKNNHSTAAVVTHGGVIMTTISILCNDSDNIFSYQADNGKGYLTEFDTKTKIMNVLDKI